MPKDIQSIILSNIKNQKCRECGDGYSAKFIVLTGIEAEATIGLCETCRARQLERDKLEEMKLAKIAEDAEIAIIRKTWREREIPELYQNKGFHDFKTNRGNLKKIKDACMKYVKEFPLNYRHWLLINKKSYGSLMLGSNENGTGKTHLTCAIAHEILNRWNNKNAPCPIRFISEGDIYRNITATYSYSYEEKTQLASEDEIVRRLIGVPLLILDDLGKEERRDLNFIQRIMFSIIDGRYRANKPMVVTTNKSGEELLRYLGDGHFSACLDRLEEMCDGNKWEIVAESYRVNPIK